MHNRDKFNMKGTQWVTIMIKGVWKKFSITKKLFCMTVSVILIFFAFFVLSQLFMFETYYTHRQTAQLKRITESFSEEYLTLDSREDVNSSIVKYSNKSNAYIVILGGHGEVLHTVSYEMVITPDGGDERDVILLDNAIRDEAFSEMNLKQGDRVEVKYRKMGDGNIHIPTEIRANGKSWHSRERDEKKSPPGFHEPKQPESEAAFLSGEIVGITLPNQQSARLNEQRNEAFSVIMEWSRELAENGEITESMYHCIYAATELGTKYNVVAKRLENGSHTEYVLTLSPMQAIDDAVVTMRSFTLYICIIGIVICAFFSLVFSKAVTRYILQINNVTRKMKELDFSERCVVKGEDELGMLAANINAMSDSLASTINALRDANEKLRTDIERERLLEQQRRDFVAAASHELKTPLAIIRAYSEALTDGISAEKRDRYLNVIVDETKKMDELVLEMLENSKLEAGAQKLRPKEYDMTELVRQIVKRFYTPCESKGITLEADFPGEAVIRVFDRELLGQVITNFLTNAMRYAESRICVSVTEGRVSVENDGPKLSEDELDKVWDKFYRTDKARERAGGGSGLGLSISKNILLLHKAEFGVKNTETGVCFWFEIK